MDVELTREADYLLCVLYDAYRQNRNRSMPPDEAKAFGGSEQIQEDYIQIWPTHDIDDAAFELYEKGLLEALFECGELVESLLTNKAIAYMDHRFNRNVDNLLHHIDNLVAIFTKFRPS